MTQNSPVAARARAASSGRSPNSSARRLQWRSAGLGRTTKVHGALGGSSRAASGSSSAGAAAATYTQRQEAPGSSAARRSGATTPPAAKPAMMRPTLRQRRCWLDSSATYVVSVGRTMPSPTPTIRRADPNGPMTALYRRPACQRRTVPLPTSSSRRGPARADDRPGQRRPAQHPDGHQRPGGSGRRRVGCPSTGPRVSRGRLRRNRLGRSPRGRRTQQRAGASPVPKGMTRPCGARSASGCPGQPVLTSRWGVDVSIASALTRSSAITWVDRASMAVP